MSLFALLAAIWLTAERARAQDPMQPGNQAEPAFERATTPKPDAVSDAIKRGVNFLYQRRDGQNMWEPVAAGDRPINRDPNGVPSPAFPWATDSGQWGGTTSLITYALLAAGEDHQKQELTDAVNFLKRNRDEVIGVYAVSMRTQVWRLLPPSNENQQMMLRDASFLREAVQGNARGMPFKRNTGLFDYTLVETDRIDLSVSQFGVLGLWSAAQYGLEVPPDYWKTMESAWLRFQAPNGGWAYHGEPEINPVDPNNRFAGVHPICIPITTAGVASLFITQDYLHAREAAACRGNYQSPAINAGMNFLAEGFPYLLEKLPYDRDDAVAEARISSGFHRLYALYGMERIGVASGRKYIGDLDWYAEGATYLLQRQRDDGSWGSPTDTAFALLFLSYGSQPVYMNKLAYATSRPDLDDMNAEVDVAQRVEGSWNQRPRDVANLARYIGSVDERSLNWQIVTLLDDQEAAVRELHDAPILYLSGGDFVNFTKHERDILRRYIDTGGLILGNADCGNRRFSQGFKRLGDQLFADQGYEWRVLPDDHPIFTEEKFNFSQQRRKPVMLGLTNGVRELMLLVESQDPARAWQLADTSKPEQFQLGANIYLYAVDKQEQPRKGDSFLTVRDDTPAPGKVARVARIKFNGNWNPEPAAWNQLSARLHNSDEIDLQIETVELGSDLSNYDVAHLTATHAVQFTDAQKQSLKQYVDGGGTLLVDAAGGSSAFATAIEAVLRDIFGDAASTLRQPLPVQHALYTQAEPAIKDVGYRLYARKTLGSADAPRLRGIEISGRLAVILSNEDLTNGLLGTPVDGVLGYSPDTASDLVRAVLQLATR